MIFLGRGFYQSVNADGSWGDDKLSPRGLWLTRDDGVLLFLVLFQQIGR